MAVGLPWPCCWPRRHSYERWRAAAALELHARDRSEITGELIGTAVKGSEELHDENSVGYRMVRLEESTPDFTE